MLCERGWKLTTPWWACLCSSICSRRGDCSPPLGPHTLPWDIYYGPSVQGKENGTQRCTRWETVKSFSCVRLFVIPRTAAHQAPLSMGFFQARILEWVAISFSRGFSWPRGRTWVSCLAGRFFIIWATREAQDEKAYCRGKPWVHPSPRWGGRRDKVHSSLSCSEEETWRARLVNPVMKYRVRGRAETDGESAQKGQQKKRLRGENSLMGLGVILRAICHGVCVCDPMDCSRPGSFVIGILQASMLISEHKLSGKISKI